MDDGKFFLDKDSLDDEFETNIADDLIIKLASTIREDCSRLVDAVRMNDHEDAQAAGAHIAQIYDKMMTVLNSDIDDMTDVELEALCKTVRLSTAKIDFNNVDEIVKEALIDPNTEAEAEESKNDDSDSDDAADEF